MMHTLAIVEDDNRYALVIKKLIDMQPDMSCVGIYGSIQACLSPLAEMQPDVILLDIQLPDGKGSDFVDVIKKICEKSIIIICTSFTDDEYIFKSIKNGALGYMLKSDSAEHILQSIRDAVAGGSPINIGVARKIISFFTTKKNTLAELTPKENEVLALFADGLMYKEIAAMQNISIDTVRKHAGNIYKKLHVSNKVEAVNIYKKQ
jgi:two-component system, NarL family, response regulator LiaR